MKEIHTKIKWQGAMAFAGENDRGHKTLMDTSTEAGGEDKNATPKELVLHGLAGCTAMDVVAILRKMRLEPDLFEVEAKTALTDEHPRVFGDIHLVFTVSGDVPEEKVKRAVDLSQEKYCGVAAMLRKHSNLTYEIKVKSAVAA